MTGGWTRVLVSAAVLLMTAGCVGDDGVEPTAEAPPTADELLRTDDQGLFNRPSVPGLAKLKPFLHESDEEPSVLTQPQCISLWNTRAPRATTQWIAAKEPSRAVVTIYEEGVQTIGDNAPPRVYTQCAFGVAISSTELVLAIAPPPNEPWRGALLRSSSPSELADLVERFNATVSSDGTLRHDSG